MSAEPLTDTPARALLYGATGYTGRLITRFASNFGIQPILAGRDAQRTRAIAEQYGFESRSFALDDPSDIRKSLDGVRVVLNCAGPFSRTAPPLVDACIGRGVHYIDITGEIDVFEALAARDAEAREAGVLLLPGAGFDVVPSDCLAAWLKQRLPSATRLMLGIVGSGGLSRGTLSTMIEQLDRAGRVRRDGRIIDVPAAWRTRNIDFGRGTRPAVTIPWGDVSTAFHSTGIPNIEVYAAASSTQIRLMKLAAHFHFVTRQRWFKRLAQRIVRARVYGPGEADFAHGSSAVWGRVEDDAGNSAEARIEGPEGYWLTAHTALLILRRVLAGDFQPGFKTPSLLYGPDLVLEVPGTRRVDL